MSSLSTGGQSSDTAAVAAASTVVITAVLIAVVTIVIVILFLYRSKRSANITISEGAKDNGIGKSVIKKLVCVMDACSNYSPTSKHYSIHAVSIIM